MKFADIKSPWIRRGFKTLTDTYYKNTHVDKVSHFENPENNATLQASKLIGIYRETPPMEPNESKGFGEWKELEPEKIRKWARLVSKD